MPLRLCVVAIGFDVPCYHPLPAWYGKSVNPTGKRSVVFSLSDAHSLYRGEQYKLEVPCGRCIGCRLERSRRWALRCLHESKLWESNYFVTLTYSPENLPPNESLRPRDFVLFMKRLRYEFGPGVRFFQAGEYGERLGRPHHHALLFNLELNNLRKWSGSGVSTLWRSPDLERLWPHGFASVGQVSFESAAYVARYALKKVTGRGAEAHYKGKVPEYCTMSRRPGIGRGFFDRYRSDMYPGGTVTLRGGIKGATPRYYDSLYEKVEPEKFKKLVYERKQKGLTDPDNSGRRLVEREAVRESGIALRLCRSFEDGVD